MLKYLLMIVCLLYLNRCALVVAIGCNRVTATGAVVRKDGSCLGIKRDYMKECKDAKVAAGASVSEAHDLCWADKEVWSKIAKQQNSWRGWIDP